RLDDRARLDDVRVVQARGEARLVDEHLQQLRVLQVRALEELENDELVHALRAALHGHEDLRGPPSAELEQEVMSTIRGDVNRAIAHTREDATKFAALTSGFPRALAPVPRGLPSRCVVGCCF